MFDRRREIRTDSATLGAILIVMGWYASPLQPMDTLFTRVLVAQGLETTWAVAMMVAGVLKISLSLIARPPKWLLPHWERISAITTVSIVMISWWTFFQFAVEWLFTPTVLALGVIGCGALATLVRDAVKKRALRCQHGLARAF